LRGRETRGSRGRPYPRGRSRPPRDLCLDPARTSLPERLERRVALRVYDSGPDGVRGNSDDELFAVQGIILPGLG
jgi:hypothetical protein